MTLHFLALAFRLGVRDAKANQYRNQTMQNLHTILCRRAESARDWDAARALLLSYGPEFSDYGRQAGYESNMEWLTQEIAGLPEIYTPPDHVLLLAWQDETAIGIIGLHRDEPLSCELKRLFVRPEYRGLGAGKMLVLTAMDAARAMNCKRVFLATWASMRTAIALYERLGFQHFAWRSSGAAWEDHAAFLECDLKERP